MSELSKELKEFAIKIQYNIDKKYIPIINKLQEQIHELNKRLNAIEPIAYESSLSGDLTRS